MGAAMNVHVADTGVPPPSIATRRVDPRACFLLRASIQFDLLQYGETSIDAAFAAIVPIYEAIRPCVCDIDRLRRWEMADRHRRRWRRR